MYGFPWRGDGKHNAASHSSSMTSSVVNMAADLVISIVLLQSLHCQSHQN